MNRYRVELRVDLPDGSMASIEWVDMTPLHGQLDEHCARMINNLLNEEIRSGIRESGGCFECKGARIIIPREK